MSQTLGSFLLSFVLSLILGAALIPLLRRLKAGQSIREEGPKWHMSKQGTPTMGGLMFIIPVTITVLTVGMPSLLAGDTAGAFILVFALIFGAIGFLDDYFKVIRKTNLGLTALQKFLLQMAAAAAFLVLLRATGWLSGAVTIPFLSIQIDIAWWLYLFIALFYVVGFVNAVNLTDGIDGLAAGVTVPVAACYTGTYLLLQGHLSSGAVFAAALAGGLIGFLFYNFHPAKVFMGDTGSLFLGGALCGLTFACDQPLLLIPVGAIYLVEMFSVVLQVLCFKFGHGWRPFRMAPIHHHFELGGWSEKKIFLVFVLITAVLCGLTYWFAVLPLVS